MRAFLAAVLVFVLIVAWAVLHGTKVEATCGPTVSTPAVVKLLDGAEVAGKALHSLQDMYQGGPTPLEVAIFVRRVMNLIGLVGDTFGAALRGERPPKDAEGLRREAERNQTAALAGCSCREPDKSPQPPAPDPGFDPRSLSAASLQSSNGFTAEQRRITATASQVAREHGLPPRAVLIAVTAGLVESGMRNLPYGDRDSQGVWQQRPSAGWGTVAQVRNPRLAAEAFYGVARHTNNRGLVDVSNWRRRPIGKVAQAIQKSAFPGRYQTRVAEAERLIASVGAAPAEPIQPALPALPECEPTPTPKAQAIANGSLANLTNRRTPTEAVAFMQSMVDRQTDDGKSRCLHWVGMAYGYPTTADNWAIHQWRNAPQKYKHPGDTSPPAGALMFWDTGSFGHVALSAGGGMVYSTDTSARDRVGLKPMSYFNGYGKYVGWTDPIFRGQTRTGVQA